MLTKAEASAMRADRKIEKIGKATYRQIAAPEPSNSRQTAACLTGGSRFSGDGGDMHVLAGRHFRDGRISREQRERIAAWAPALPAA
ncbi:MAG: hypothetical protein ACLGSD_13880 [Acidobacteriota bacterium]